MAVNLSGNTALHAAVETGQTEVVQFLLNREEQNDAHKLIGAKNVYGQTPLGMAKILGRSDIMDMLMSFEKKFEL